MSENKGGNPRVWIGIILIIIGGLFIIDNYGMLDIRIPFEILAWQNILIVVGLISLVASSNKTVGVVLIAVGAIGHFPELWPILLIALGIYIIYRRSGTSTGEAPNSSSGAAFTSSDYLNDTAIFGGGKKVIDSNNFKGGKTTAIFGGSEIDLVNTKLAPGEHVIDTFAMFGGTTFFVPKNMKVIVDIIAIFGGFSDERRKDVDTVYDEESTLRIKGFVLFGGGEVKSA